MKSVASLTLALAASIVAAQDEILPIKRDVATISNVIMQVTTSLNQLDASVKAFNGQSFSQLATDAGNVKTTLANGAKQISGTSNITAQEAVQLQSSLSPVQTAGTNLINDLSAKKPQIQQASLCQTVQQQTQEIGTSAKDLIEATVSKVPQNLQAVAGQLTSQLTSQLSDVSLNFAPGNCTNGGLALSNGSAAPGTTTMGGKSSASIQAASVFGIVLAGAVTLLIQ